MTENKKVWQAEEQLNMAAFLPRSLVNGPGLRAVIWVQGCPRRCVGCFNQDFLADNIPRELISVYELSERLAAIADIEGITFSGGEPFLQAAALATVAEGCRQRGLNVTTFTGYTLAELQEAKNPDWDRLLAATDLLIAGPYQPEKPSSRYLCGSENQEIIFLTETLRNHPAVHGSDQPVLEKSAGPTKNNNNDEQSWEYIIGQDGVITVTGIIPVIKQLNEDEV